MTDIKEKIVLGGVKQKIHVRTNDESKPVLLFLHGGPGIINRHSIMCDHADLLDTFTIATWDQRGSGGSNSNIPADSLTIDRITRDAEELVEWLCRRFNKEKIFVIGGSWGSELGVWLSYRFPEHIAAFVGFGQVVNIDLNEKISYEYTLNSAKEAGDTDAVRKLEEVGPPVMGVYKGGYSGMMVQRKLMMKYGGYSKNEGKQSYIDAVAKPMLKSGEYSFSDIVGFLTGYSRVLKTMWEEIGRTNFPETCTEFKMPIFIFDGKLDMNTPAELVEDWFNMIKAPRKELIWFENSGHNPMGDEGDRFKKLLREKLTEVKDGSDSVI